MVAPSVTMSISTTLAVTPSPTPRPCNFSSLFDQGDTSVDPDYCAIGVLAGVGVITLLVMCSVCFVMLCCCLKPSCCCKKNTLQRPKLSLSAGTQETSWVTGNLTGVKSIQIQDQIIS